MYNLEIKEEADKVLKKLSKKDPAKLRIIDKKIKEITLNPNHIYKFLTKPLQTYNRVHINSSFVLIFKISHERKTVVVYYFDHHDNVYKWRPKDD